VTRDVAFLWEIILRYLELIGESYLDSAAALMVVVPEATQDEGIQLNAGGTCACLVGGQFRPYGVSLEKVQRSTVIGLLESHDGHETKIKKMLEK
jgi:hypothetical protein